MSLNSVQFIVTFIVLLAILSMLQLFRTDNACSVVSKIQSTLILAYSYLFSASVNIAQQIYNGWDSTKSYDSNDSHYRFFARKQGRYVVWICFWTYY